MTVLAGRTDVYVQVLTVQVTVQNQKYSPNIDLLTGSTGSLTSLPFTRHGEGRVAVMNWFFMHFFFLFEMTE